MKISNAEEIKEYVARNASRLVPKLTRIYNSMCGRCRQMCLSKPGRPMTDYCNRCQEMFKRILEDEVK